MVKRGILVIVIFLSITAVSISAQNQFSTGIIINPNIVTMGQQINITINAGNSFKFFETASLCGETGKIDIHLNGRRFSRAVIENNSCIRNCQPEPWFEGTINTTFTFPQDTQDGTYTINAYGCRIITGKWNCTWFSGIVQYASDILPPVILTLSPENNVVVPDGRSLQLSMTFSDQGSNIDPDKVSFILTGANTIQEPSIRPSSVTQTTAAATLTEELLKGHYSLTGIIMDKSGNSATKTNVFDVGIPKETPLIVKDLIPDIGVSSSSSRALWSIKILVQGLQEIELGKLTNNVFTDQSTGEGAILIDSIGNTNWEAQQIILRSERGTHNAFLPAGANIGCGQGRLGQIKYYIAADGSSYFADSTNNGCGTLLNIESALKQDHIARGAQ